MYYFVITDGIKNAVSVIVRVLDGADVKIKEQSFRCLGGVMVL